MRKTLLTLAAFGLLLLAGTQTAFAKEGHDDDGQGRDHRDDARDGRGRPDGKGEDKGRAQDAAGSQGRGKDDHERGEGRGKAMREAHGAKAFGKADVTLTLNGTATFRNETYAFELTANGTAAQRVKGNDSGFVRYNGRLDAHYVLTGPNGTVEGDTRIKIFARSEGNETRWVVGSVAQHGGVRFILKGTVEAAGEGDFNLTGRGHAVLKQDGQRAIPLKLQVDGSFTRTALTQPPQDDGTETSSTGTTSDGTSEDGSSSTTSAASTGATTSEATSSTASETTSSTTSETTSSTTSESTSSTTSESSTTGSTSSETSSTSSDDGEA